MNDNSRNELCNMNKYDPSIIAKRIKDAAYSKNITIKELCSTVGVGENTVQQMSKTRRAPSVVTVARIADVLAVSVDTLLDRAAPTTTDTTAPTNADTTTNAPPSVGQAVQTIADYLHTSPDYVRGALRLPPDDKNSTL